MPFSSTRQGRPRRPRSRAQLLVGLTAVLAAIFGVTAWRTAVADRHNVEEATCMFAAAGARILQARSQVFLSLASEPVFAAVGGRDPTSATEPLPSPALLAQASNKLKDCHCAPELPTVGFFRFDLDSGRLSRLTLVSLADAPVGENSDPVSTSVDTIGLRATLSADLPSLRGSDVFAAGIRDSAARYDSIRVVAIVMGKYDTGARLRAVYGLIEPTVPFVRAVIAPVFDSVSLFSGSLADTSGARQGWACCDNLNLRNRDVGNMEVDDSHWRPLYRTGPMPDTATGCLGYAEADPALASVYIEFGPLPHTWSSWVGKTLAFSRTPSLLILLAAVLLSGVAAAITAQRDAELAALRSDFVTSISHELRMPLAQILLAGETLSLGRTRTQAERDEAADAIVREAQRLSGLVDNVLFFSRIEHHNVQITPVAANVADVVSDIVACVAPLAAGAGASVNATVPTDVFGMLDRSAFRQVLYNLLDNAFKYGSRGQHVFVGVTVPPDSPDHVQVWVEDEGPGIPRGQESAIFEPFVRLEREGDKAVAGSGLGLAVVRYLVNSQGGRIWVEHPASGRGARFVIELKRAAEPSTQEQLARVMNP
jgi:signal transduction histidine kinase